MPIQQVKLKQLCQWQQLAFAAALTQRMLPNYDYFSKASGFGNYSQLANQLDVIWQKLAGLPINFSVEAQLEKLRSQIPEEREFDIYAVRPAIDVCTALESLFSAFEDKHAQPASEISQLSEGCVLSYIDFLNLNSAAEPEEGESDPLLSWEQATQEEVYEFVVAANQNKSNIDTLKRMVTEERISNLAIEF